MNCCMDLALAAAITIVPTTAVAQDYEDVETPWLIDATEFNCPAQAVLGAAITLKKSNTAGRELGVVDPDGNFLFLVVGLPDRTMKSLMTPAALKAAKVVSPDPKVLTGYDGTPNRRVLQKSEIYTFQVSDNLASGAGGYTCKTRVVARK